MIEKKERIAFSISGIFHFCRESKNERNGMIYRRESELQSNVLMLMMLLIRFFSSVERTAAEEADPGIRQARMTDHNHTTADDRRTFIRLFEGPSQAFSDLEQ